VKTNRTQILGVLLALLIAGYSKYPG